MAEVERVQQTIRATVVDHMAEPDAFRGSEHVLRNITDSDGKAITVLDQEESRRLSQAEAVQSRAPLRMTSPQTQTPAEEITPDTPTSSPNVQRAPLSVGDSASGRANPVQTDPGMDWQAKARAEGWRSPTDETRSVSTLHGFPPSDQPTEADPDFRPTPGQVHPLDVPAREEYRAPEGPPVDPQYRAPYTRTDSPPTAPGER